MKIIGHISYSMTEPSAPEYLADQMSMALIGHSGAFNVIPVRSFDHKRNGLVFTEDYPAHVSQEVTDLYVAECQQWFIDELNREKVEMYAEYDDEPDLE